MVEGAADGELRLKYVIHTEDVRLGDKVLTSGAAGVYPKGVLVGTVSDVRQGPGGVFQIVQIDPAVDFGRLEEVLVLLHRRQLDQ